MSWPGAILAAALAPLSAGSVLAQQIRRHADARSSITYPNADGPAGTRPVRAVQPAPSPSPEEEEAARQALERDAQTAKQLSDQRLSQQAAAAPQRQQQRNADCYCLRGEIQSLQRMRNVVVNRPYYSLDDLNQMDQHVMRRMTGYERACE
jgi:hypothetical protein